VYPSSFANYTWYWILLPPFHTFYTLQVIQARFWLEGFLGEQAWQILSFALVCTWRGSSIVAILLLAGFRAIPQHLLEYARLETASPLRYFWSVVLPLSRRFVVLAGVVGITVAYLDYLAMFLESNGRITVPVLGTLVYRAELVDGQTGYAAALSMTQLPIILALVLVAVPLIDARLSRRKMPEPTGAEARPFGGGAVSKATLRGPEAATARARARDVDAADDRIAAPGRLDGSAGAVSSVTREGASGLGSSSAAGPRWLVMALLSLACVAIAIFYLFPLYYTVIQSIKSADDFLTGPIGQPFWPYGIDFGDGWIDTLQSPVFWRSALNTAVIFGLVVVVGITVALLAGYALARLRLPGAEWLARALFAAYFVPQLAVVVPLLQLYSAVGLENTYLGVILVYLTLAIPFATWLFYTYFTALDAEVEEHALLDGSRLRVFVQIVLPRAWPVVVAGAVFGIGMMSSDLLYARVFTLNQATRTLPVTMGSLVYDPDNWADANTSVLFAVVPLLVVALALGRTYIRGLAQAFSDGGGS